MRTKFLIALMLAVLGPVPVFAQSTFPSQPIRMVIGLTAGGSTDIAGRTLAEDLRVILGQPVVNESKPGANGLIALQDVVQAKPDGHTLLLGSSSTASINIIARDKMDFDPDTKMTVLAALAEGPPLVLVVRKEVPVANFKEFIAYAKANPGKLRYASPGTQTSPHLDIVQLARKEGLQMIHLPQKGAGGIIPALANGDANLALINSLNIAGQVKAGDVKVLAVVHPTRARDYPDVPTLAELGHPDIGTVLWHVVYARSDTPKEILDKLADAFEKAKKGEKMQAFYKSAEMIEPKARTRPEAESWWKRNMDHLRKVFAEVGDAK